MKRPMSVLCLAVAMCGTGAAIAQEKGSVEAYRKIAKWQNQISHPMDPFREEASTDKVVTEASIEDYLQRYLKLLNERHRAAKRGRVNRRAEAPAVWQEKWGRYVFATREAREETIAKFEQELNRGRGPIHGPNLLKINKIPDG